MQLLTLLATLGGLLGKGVAAGPAPGFAARNIESSWMPKETVGFMVDVAKGGPPQPTSPPEAPWGEMELVRRFSGYTMGSDTCGFISSFWGALLVHARGRAPEFEYGCELTPSPRSAVHLCADWGDLHPRSRGLYGLLRHNRFCMLFRLQDDVHPLFVFVRLARFVQCRVGHPEDALLVRPPQVQFARACAGDIWLTP